MRILISLCSLMLAGALASDSYKAPHAGGVGYGHAPHGHGGHYPPYSYNDLKQLADFIKDVSAEKTQLGNRVYMLKDQQSNLLAKIDQIQTVNIPGFNAVQDTQDASLEAIRQKIKDLFHDIDDEVAALDGEVAVAKRQEASVNPQWAQILELVASNNAQSALLAKIDRQLAENKEKLFNKLQSREEASQALVTELKYNTKALGDLVNTRHCLSITVPVEVDPKTSVTEVSEYLPAGFFGSLTPTAYCSMLEVSSHINLDRHKSGGHGGYGSYGYGYSDLYQNLALTIDCKPFSDRLEVSVFDQSKGANNIIDTVYVAAKLCTMGAQASGLDHL